MKQFITISLILIFVTMLLRKPDKIIKLTQLINETFRTAWLSLVKQ